MCLLTFYPEGKCPDSEAVESLWNGAILNSDGHGFAIVTRDNEIIVKRGLKAEDVINDFIDYRHEYPEGPALFHSRFGTAGTNDKSNCHPYYFRGRDRRTVIAHNGVLPVNVWPQKHDPRSDTRIAAEEYIPFVFEIHRSTGRKALKRWATKSNKLVILTVDPKYTRNAFIIHEDQGIWDNGIWYSNSGYQRAYTYDKWDDKDLEKSILEYETCGTCKSLGMIDWDRGICEWCHHCIDCDSLYPTECQCWLPPNFKAAN